MNDHVCLLSTRLVYRTLVKVWDSWECCKLLMRTCSGCQTVGKDSEEGDWVSSDGHQHFSFSITSTTYGIA